MSAAMKRREFITLLGGAAAWPLVARAQQPAIPVVGFLNSASPDGQALYVAAFREGVRQTGNLEGRDVTIEFSWANNQNDRLPALAADFVQRRVAVISALSNASAFAAKAATSTIPIVFAGSVDPVADGLVASLNRPGGNATGVTTLNVELGPKRVELLHVLIPASASIAALVNPTNPVAETDTRKVEEAARSLGRQIHILHASSEREFDSVFATLAQLRAGALLIVSDNFFNSRTERLAALTMRHAVPAIYQYRQFAAAGGLMSYGGNLEELYREVGIYTGRIVKGAKPGDLPVQQLSRIGLIINLKTARALGLTVPLPLLGRADEVIE
jgi:putative tryptophan/tyrosine transport system substrate-binding protein